MSDGVLSPRNFYLHVPDIWIDTVMSTGIEPTITLTDEGEWWVAKDTETGVASQGKTREEALDNLDEAVALHKDEVGEAIDSWNEEREALEELGIDPEEVATARDEERDLPEFMR